MKPERLSAPVRRSPRIVARAREPVALDIKSSENAAQPSSDGCNAAQGSPNGEKTQVSTFKRREARHYSWAQFGKDNTVALRHGAESARVILARAQAVRGALTELCPWIGEQDAFLFSAERFCRVAARAFIVSDYIAEVVETRGAAAVPQRIWEIANSTDRLARDLGNDLGLDPAGFAALKSSASNAEIARKALDDLRAEGAEIRAVHDPSLATGTAVLVDVVPDIAVSEPEVIPPDQEGTE